MPLSLPKSPDMMIDMKCYGWNCRGLGRSRAQIPLYARYFFWKTFLSDYDWFFFLDTHHKNESDIPNKLLRYDATYHVIQSQAEGQDKYSGIIGLISKRYDITDVDQMLRGRIIGKKLQDSSTKKIYQLSVVYFLTNQYLTMEKFIQCAINQDFLIVNRAVPTRSWVNLIS